MPHFNHLGHDTYLCQFCATVRDGQLEPSLWVEGRGNKCCHCVDKEQKNQPAPEIPADDPASEKEEIKSGPIDLAKYNGKITVTNPRSNEHRTFKIHTVRNGKLKDKRIVSLLRGSEYQGFGFVDDNGSIFVWKNKRDELHIKYARILDGSKYYAEKYNLVYQFSVKCRCCNRDLTDPVSIELGIGQVCREKKGINRISSSTSVKPPISLYEHCRQESGGLEGLELDRYVNRYYGHN